MSMVGLVSTAARPHDDPWLVIEPPGNKSRATVVLVSGDEEYRSEEALPALARVLACRHALRCVVLFALDPATGEINPDRRDHLPGLEHLEGADLLVIATRFRELRDADMARVDAYVESGRPILGLRTSTHAFRLGEASAFRRYSWDFEPGESADVALAAWRGGFGRHVLGETWVAHHGDHGRQGTRGLIVAPEHPIARGLASRVVFGPTDVYAVRDLPGDAEVIVRGLVVEGLSADAPAASGRINDPAMPLAWARRTPVPGAPGSERRVFTTTMGAATDLREEGTRVMLVNAVYWLLGWEDEIPAEGCGAALVGAFEPTDFGFGGFRRGVTPGTLDAECEPRAERTP